VRLAGFEPATYGLEVDWVFVNLLCLIDLNTVKLTVLQNVLRLALFLTSFEAGVYGRNTL
jgi:hypothetical protein